MPRQNDKNLKQLHVLSIGILSIGFLGILMNLIVQPDKFPVLSLYATAIGAMLSVAVSTKYLMWRQYENKKSGK